MSKRIVVIGAGPIGLETALYAKHLGFEVTVLEKNEVAANVAEWGFVRLFSPFSMNHTPLAKRLLAEKGVALPKDDAYLTGDEFIEKYLHPLADLLADHIVENCEVTDISRKHTLKDDHIGTGERSNYPFRIVANAHESDPEITEYGDVDLNEFFFEQQFEADIVIDTSGTYGNPNWLGDGGIPALGERALRDEIDYHLIEFDDVNAADFIGKTTLLVGSGQSAATTVQQFEPLLKQSPKTRLVWLTRDNAESPIREIADDPLPGRLQVAKDANRLAKHPQVHWQKSAAVVMIEPDDDGYIIVVNTPDGDEQLRVDNIIANVGYSPDNSIYRELQVHECYASRAPMKLSAALLAESSDADCLTQTGKGADVLVNPEPNFFIIGMKSYGRNSNFLMRVGHEQIRDIFTLITGDATLDLYKK